MILTQEQMFEAIENYACDQFGIVSKPVIHIIINNDV